MSEDIKPVLREILAGVPYPGMALASIHEQAKRRAPEMFQWCGDSYGKVYATLRSMPDVARPVHGRYCLMARQIGTGRPTAGQFVRAYIDLSARDEEIIAEIRRMREARGLPQSYLDAEAADRVVSIVEMVPDEAGVQVEKAGGMPPKE